MRRIVLCLIVASLLFTGCASTNVDTQTQYVVLKSAISEDIGLELVTDGDMVYSRNITSGDVTKLRLLTEPVREALYMKLNWDIEETLDPDNLEEVTPATYHVGLDDSVKVLNHFYSEQWSLYSVLSNDRYVDIRLEKHKSYIRIIILDGKLKIFYNVSGNTTDPLTYIIERREE